MTFWNRKGNIIIQCSICEWKPDGGIYWACTCGHSWNTFDTKGKCPKCKTRWEETFCPSCRRKTAHKDWYKTKEEIESIESSGDQTLRGNKRRLESRLIQHGIRNSRVSNLPYLDHSTVTFQTTYDAGCRMVILYAIAYSCHNLEKRHQVTTWLKSENIWDKVSNDEKEFLNNPFPNDDLRMELSWRIEGALVLGWCLKKVDKLPKVDEDNNEAEIVAFQKNIPEMGGSLTLFLSNLEYRDMNEIYQENLLNESITSYFRDLVFNGKEDETQINRLISFERHKTLNWLRNFGDMNEWDRTDTST